MIDWEVTKNRCGLAELKEGVRTGAEYTYSSQDHHWYCTAHKSWRHRWLKQPAIFSVELKKIALEKGISEKLFERKMEEEVTKTKKKKGRKKKEKNFISLF